MIVDLSMAMEGFGGQKMDLYHYVDELTNEDVSLDGYVRFGILRI